MDYENGTLYTLTSNGVAAFKFTNTQEVYAKEQWHKFELEEIARHEDKKQRQPLAIAAEQKVFVVYQNSTQTFESDLTLLSNLTMRDVKLITASNSSIAAITCKTIRVLSIKEKLELKTSIDLEGVVAASMQGQSLLIATAELYELVDLTLSSRIPLFPSPESPLIVPIPPLEFLVVQGTAPDEPAMGLVVKFTGEASRQPIMWDFCPTSIAVDGQLVFALGSKLVAHSLETQELVQEYDMSEIWPFESQPALKNTHAMWVKTEQNIDLLGKPSTVACRTALYAGNDIVWFVPKSPLADAQTKILSGKSYKIGPLDPIETEYLQILRALGQLKESPSKAVEPFIKLGEVGSKLARYIYGDFAKVETFPGLMDLVEQLKSKPPPDFYKSFLKQLDWSEDELYYERLYAALLEGSELVDFLLNCTTPQLEGLSPDTMEEYWTKKGDRTKLFELWYARLATDKAYTRKIVEALSGINDADFVWKEALKLIKIDPNGVQVFIKKSKAKFDPDKVLETLKSVDGDVAYRTFLRHLVYKKKKVVFAQDLTMIVVDDLIEQYNTEEVKAAVKASYEAYRALAWPKRPYLHFLQEYKGGEAFKSFVDLETEFATLVKDGSDMAPIISIIDEHAPELWVERCAVYRKLGLHNQCIDFLVDNITDYMAVLWYCLYDASGKPLDEGTRLDLARYTLRCLAVSAPGEVISEHLEKQKLVLPLADVLNCLPDSTPASVVEDVLVWHLDKHQSDKRRSQLARALTQGEFKWQTTTVKNLRAAARPVSETDC